jgi:hypothetical protein
MRKSELLKVFEVHFHVFSLHFYTWVASNNLFQHLFVLFFLFFGFREEEAQEEA